MRRSIKGLASGAFVLLWIVGVTGVSVPVEAGSAVEKELEKLGGGFQVVTPCELLTETSLKGVTEHKTHALLQAQEYEGRWIGGAWSQENGWEPRFVELSCGGDSVPLMIENNEVIFPVEERLGASVFRGIRKGEKLVGWLDGDESRRAIFFPLKSTVEEGHSTTNQPATVDFPEAILDSAGGGFASVFEVEGQWYFFDGETLLPAWPHRDFGLVDVQGNFYERLFEVGKQEFQIVATSPEGVRTNYPTWISIDEKQRGDFLYYTTLQNREVPVVIFQPGMDAVLTPLFHRVLIQYYTRFGFCVLIPVPGSSFSSTQDWSTAVNEMLAKEVRHDETKKITVGNILPFESLQGGYTNHANLVFNSSATPFWEKGTQFSTPFLLIEQAQEAEPFPPTTDQMVLRLAAVDSPFSVQLQEYPELGVTGFRVDPLALNVLLNWSRKVSEVIKEKPSAPIQEEELPR